jgi:hypothetical protein
MSQTNSQEKPKPQIDKGALEASIKTHETATKGGQIVKK